MIISFKINWEANFPPRKGQLEVAKTIAEALKVREDVVFVAPTGFGKTIAVLTAIKSINFFPAIWLIRSLKLAKRIAADASLLKIKTFSAAGREKTCRYALEFGDAIHIWCKLNRARCSFFLNLLKKSVNFLSITSWEELVNLEEICPYYAQDIVANNAELIIQNYHRRILPAKVVVIDESHNLLVPQEYKVSRDVILTAAAELLAMGETEMARRVERAASIPELVFGLKDYLDNLEIMVYEALKKLSKVKGLPKLVWLLKILFSGGAFYRESSSESITVYTPPWKPRIKPRIFISATIPKEMERLLGVDISIRVPIQQKQAIVTMWLTTKFGEETIEDYRKLIIYLQKKFNRILIFATERIAKHIASLSTHYEPEKISGNWQGVLLLHTRGRYSEGVDIPSDVIAILGCPFLPPEVTRNLKRAYERIGLSGDVAFWAPMVITTLQAIGRSIRSPDANPLIILGDERFLCYEKFFSPYLKMIPVNTLSQIC